MKRTWSDRWWTTADGLRLYARDYAGADGAARLPVVCLHGLTRNSRDFEDLAPRIAETGRRVLAFDVRGRGRSDYDPEPSNYHVGTYVQDLIGQLAALGVGRAVFVGTSMGGLITMILSTSRPDMIGAVVLNDVGPKLSTVGLARIMSYVGRAGDPPRNWREAADYVRKVNGAAFPNFGRGDWRRFARRVFDTRDGRPVLAYDPEIAAPFRSQASAAQPDLGPVFQAMAAAVPTLLVHGEISDLLDAEGVALMRALAPNMTAAPVPDVGHAPTLTEKPALAAILDLLRAVP